MMERRGYDRVPATGQVLYRRRHLFLYGRIKTGHLVNLSENGAEIGTFVTLATGGSVKLFLPGAAIHAADLGTITIRAKVIWWSHGQRENFYRVGLGFASVPTRYLAAFRAYAHRQTIAARSEPGGEGRPLP